MPISDPMTWVRSEKRWVKRIRGQGSFYFAPRKHGIDPTEAGSRAAMRQWWSAQDAILNSAADAQQKELAKRFLMRLCRNLTLGDDAMPVERQIVNNLVIDELENVIHDASVISATDTMMGDGRYQELRTLADTITSKVVVPVEASRILKHQIDRWLKQQESRVQNGQLSAGSLRCYRSAMLPLRDEYGGCLVDAITNEWVQDRFNDLSALPLSAISKCNRWTVWATFIDYLDTIGLVVKPKLLTKLSFPRDSASKKEIWTTAEYQAALADASGVRRLVLLLAANCSFYASDMAECSQHYDAEEGTITMARVKTARKNKPVVFHLWPETNAAMMMHGHELEYYKIINMDFNKPLKNLRHTSKSFILDSREFPHFVNAMTGQKAQGDNEKFYWTTSKLKEAFAYLRTCYGF